MKHFKLFLIFSLGFVCTTFAQVTIKGTITDTRGVPLPGATVIEKGTENGVVADFDGNYNIQVMGPESVIIYSSLGFSQQEILVNQQITINVKLEEDTQKLDEVVVVGYGTQKKSDVTGAVLRVSTESTEDQPNYSVLQSLQGQAPGVNITTPSRAGEEPNLLIRGTNSLTATNSPLVVVDGIIYNGNISDFNPKDIETIDILKDASATAVYGSRAANGVLLVTTKRGESIKPVINFGTYVGFQVADNLVNVLDGPGYERKIADFNDILLADNPVASPVELTDIEIANRDAGIQTDWIDETLRTGSIRNYNLNVSGRTAKTNYYISGAYFEQEGIELNDNFDRTTLNLNLTTDITDWYSISIKTALSTSDFSGIPANVGTAATISPYGDLYDENGPGGFAFLPFGDPLGENPLINTLIDDQDKRLSLWGVVSSNLEVPFIPGLKWTLNYSNNLRTQRNNRFLDNESTVAGRLANGIAQKSNQRFYDWTLDNILNYKKTFVDKHNVDLTLLLSREFRNFEQTLATNSNFVSQELGFNNLGLAEVQQSDSNLEELSTIAQMARLNYSYDSRYAITLTARRDGYSAFSEDNKYSIFPAAAFAWTVSNEKFMESFDWLSNLKLRLSYGENGNRGIDRFSTFQRLGQNGFNRLTSLSRIGIDQYLFGNGGSTIATYNVASLGNNELTWETTTSQNIGLDFGLFKNRIVGNIEAYVSNTTDLLQLRAIPTITGFSQILTNIGEVENRGIEIGLTTNNITNGDFMWSSGLAFSLNRNEILSLGGVDADGDGREDNDIANGWFIGEDINSIFGFRTNGIYQLDDDIPDGFRQGDYRLVDTNNDGDITPEDRQILGTTSPNYSLGFSNTFRYKQFSLYLLINTIQGGNGFYVGDNFQTRSVNRLDFPTFTERFNIQDVPYWTHNNPTNHYPRLDYAPKFAHPIIEDRSFVRIQDVNLSYNFSPELLERIKLRDLRFYVSAKNLFTFTDWTGYDPENRTTIQNLPFLKTFTLGFDISF
ncbi:SusC/RagA family TonB-linked outer membrane protein [Arenibacter palladensis]|uniref:SusC/RagA family TonB-linked outer membrane protein n=1 Tax=Arenibacter palladensis TaxID=237373 RepID=UPI0026E2463C|nr:TonB-dependent receptor [Arenibacter palladensis]MDO6605680.1 TonB-dependent receptor [Arenibacter palladensis]